MNDHDDQVIEHLTRIIASDDGCETVAEIAEQLALSKAQVRASLKRLQSYGEATEIGVADSGATWTLTSDPRLKR